MGKVKYDKDMKTLVRTIKVNNVSTEVLNQSKSYLESLPYRISDDVLFENCKKEKTEVK